MTTVPADRIARIFVEVADTLVDEFDLLEFLQMLVTRAADLVEGSTVGLLLTDQHADLRFMAASDESTRLLELFEVQNREGPCMDAYRTAHPVINADLRNAAARWPLFAPRATAAGYGSVHAFPLRLRREVIGALNVFGTAPGPLFDDADVQVMQALADIAAIALLQERSIHRGEVLTGQLQGALNSRVAIEQAKGMIAQAHGITTDQAFALIRGHARRGNRRLIDVATTVLTDLARIPELAPPPGRLPASSADNAGGQP
jgi:GAF domain-containing protein